MYKWFVKLHISELFVKDLNVKGTRGYSLKLKKLGCATDKLIKSTFSSIEW